MSTKKYTVQGELSSPTLGGQKATYKLGAEVY